MKKTKRENKSTVPNPDRKLLREYTVDEKDISRDEVVARFVLTIISEAAEYNLEVEVVQWMLAKLFRLNSSDRSHEILIKKAAWEAIMEWVK